MSVFSLRSVDYALSLYNLIEKVYTIFVKYSDIAVPVAFTSYLRCVER
jgi:hypothetical protein